MSTAQHTPGPWTGEPNGGDDPDPRPNYICAPNDFGGTSMIAEVDTSPHSGDWQANARLIAAAPEMWAALREAMLHLPDFADEDQPAIVKACEMARAALAKADPTKADNGR